MTELSSKGAGGCYHSTTMNNRRGFLKSLSAIVLGVSLSIPVLKRDPEIPPPLILGIYSKVNTVVLTQAMIEKILRYYLTR